MSAKRAAPGRGLHEADPRDHAKEARETPTLEYFKPRAWRDASKPVDFPIQGELKKEILKDLLRRLGGLMEVPLITIIPSCAPYGYRVRSQLKVRGKALCYFKEKSHHIVDIQECPIVHPLINQMLPFIRERFLSFSQLGEIEINVSPEENTGVLILYSPSFEQWIENVLKEFLRNHAIFKGSLSQEKTE